MSTHADIALQHVYRDPESSYRTHHGRSASESKPFIPEDDTDRLLPAHADELAKPRSTFAEKWVPKALQPQWNRLSRHLPQGWHLGASLGVVMSFTVLVVNIMVAAFSYTVIRDKGGDFVSAPISTGNCADIESMGRWIHLAINAASTLLLGASNYAMQILCAPSRKAVDEAHHKGSWLDIGVLSIRNLASIRGKKLILWLALGLSSIPLHLFYNSTFFVSTRNHHYDVYVANEQFAEGAEFDDFIGKYDQSPYYANYPLLDLPSGTDPHAVQSNISSNKGYFERLEKDDCIRNYSRVVLPDRRNVILVTKTKPADNPALHEIVAYNSTALPQPDGISCNGSTTGHILTSELGPVTCATNSSLYGIAHYAQPVVGLRSPYYRNWYYWICSQQGYYYDEDRLVDEYDGNAMNVTMPDFMKPPNELCSDGLWEDYVNSSTWSVYGFEVDYCLSEKLPGQCSLNVTVSLLLVVIVFNLIKLVAIISTISMIRDNPLITIGDAVASFIQEEDVTTRGMCLLSRDDVVQQTKQKSLLSHFKRGSTASRGGFQPLSPRPFEPSIRRYHHAASKSRWITALAL
ncbi:hypothetical protein SLS55_009637 [Diplodia seriata]|uniref:DUF6536 domain-containing protein n=1 Tax=Diplodia seriata TaxID=420778 RepID=A0ABR3C3B2_9PEZI